MTEPAHRSLRVLIADERREDLVRLAGVVGELGHEVVACEVDVGAVGAATNRLLPDVALVDLGPSSAHALQLIKTIVHEAQCPVIALLAGDDDAFVREAARRGVFAYIVDSTPAELQSAIDLTLRRFAEYHDLQGAFGRRATIEQAKGILMANHGITADAAFEMLRNQAAAGEHTITDVATMVTQTHALVAPPKFPLPRR